MQRNWHYHIAAAGRQINNPFFMKYPNHSILSCYILVVTTASVTVVVTDASEINVVNNT